MLKSRPLRSYANYISYSDKAFATEQAYLIGRLHCLKTGWERASVDFLQSGGFVVSKNVEKVKQPTLTIWGEEDQILDVSYGYKFKETLQDAELQIIPKCGHVPHLEKSEETARIMIDFLKRKQR